LSLEAGNLPEQAMEMDSNFRAALEVYLTWMFRAEHGVSLAFHMRG
jgi:hypothetical protein